MHRYPGASRMRGDSCRAASPKAHAAQLASNVRLITVRFLPVNNSPATQQKIWTLITAHDNCCNCKHKYGAHARPLIWPCGLHLSSFLFLIYSLPATKKRGSVEWIVGFSDASSKQWRTVGYGVCMTECKLSLLHTLNRNTLLRLNR